MTHSYANIHWPWIGPKRRRKLLMCREAWWLGHQDIVVYNSLRILRYATMHNMYFTACPALVWQEVAHWIAVVRRMVESMSIFQHLTLASSSGQGLEWDHAWAMAVVASNSMADHHWFAFSLPWLASPRLWGVGVCHYGRLICAKNLWRWPSSLGCRASSPTWNVLVEFGWWTRSLTYSFPMIKGIMEGIVCWEYEHARSLCVTI